jgi:hypothetical protein
VVDVSPLAALTRLTSLDLRNCESLADVSPLASLVAAGVVVKFSKLVSTG